MRTNRHMTKIQPLSFTFIEDAEYKQIRNIAYSNKNITIEQLQQQREMEWNEFIKEPETIPIKTTNRNPIRKFFCCLRKIQVEN